MVQFEVYEVVRNTVRFTQNSNCKKEHEVKCFQGTHFFWNSDTNSDSNNIQLQKLI